MRLVPVSLAIFAATASPVAAEVRLLMAEERGCIWCARWNDEIAPAYPKTAEGRAAPRYRCDLQSDEAPADLAARVHFTPTFILVRDGVELSRIEGYPGEDFFWGLLGQMLSQADIEIGQETQP